MTKEQNKNWVDSCNKWGLPELAKSLIHDCECPRHKLFHITKEALAFHKKKMH